MKITSCVYHEVYRVGKKMSLSQKIELRVHQKSLKKNIIYRDNVYVALICYSSPDSADCGSHLASCFWEAEAVVCLEFQDWTTQAHTERPVSKIKKKN